jgi:anti-anti-sigma factor
MFEINTDEHGVVRLAGRFDAAQAKHAKEVLDKIKTSCTVDFKELRYISSAGLGELLSTQKRLMDAGQSLRLINMDGHIRDVFRYAGFYQIFDMEMGDPEG